MSWISTSFEKEISILSHIPMLLTMKDTIWYLKNSYLVSFSGIININSWHYKDISSKKESYSYIDEKLKLNEKTIKTMSDFNFDCKKVDEVGQVSSTNNFK